MCSMVSCTYTRLPTHLEGDMLEIYEWDTGKYLGQIKQVEQTYSVVGNMNEHQVAIGETTYGGRKELKDPKAIMDYGSLMYIALQRAKTAREAIEVMADLVRNTVTTARESPSPYPTRMKSGSWT